MLDYKFIKDNLDAVKQNIINRNMTADADKVVELYDKRTALVTKLQGLQQKRNENAQAMKQKLDSDKRQELIAAGKSIKEEVSAVENEVKELEIALEEAARQIPNMVHPDAPVGKLDTENLEVKKVGIPRKFDFEPKDHVQLGESLDIIDFDRGTKVSGPKFYYLKNEAVFLEQALIMYALNTLRKHNFQMFITPDVAKEEVLKGIGFNPRGNESNVYSIEEEGYERSDNNMIIQKILNSLKNLIEAFKILPGSIRNKNKISSTLSKNKSILLKTLYDVNSANLLKCFSKNC